MGDGGRGREKREEKVCVWRRGERRERERDLPVGLCVGMDDWGICVVGGIKVQRLSPSRL
jgi:hypothetical protein